ncbi:LysR family transcriptional regulator [Lactiplantibacillus garii]|uniref:LysR family transcriptional regulator n=1 Tax=Lactiplantibacillus garii TaxID=2306423 RepID=A0A426D594_9LACO|nr:LysR family transcriptional regulator [Lactiplantibacillus garii]RRK09569.1 LysR family transcriptional regulator [Lactiplantibacillus garii]
MNTRDLTLFRAVVKYKNYTYVAEKFAVSQPAVTQAVKRLEKEFDAQLVKQDHAHQQMLITEAGQLLYKNSQVMNDSLELTHREIEATKQPRIRFGLPPIIGVHFFPQIAKHLLAWGWIKQIDVVEQGSAQLLADLAKGKLDLALVASAHPLHLRNLQATALGSRPFEVIVSDENPLAHRDKISFQELSDQKFIGLNNGFIHPKAFQDYCQAAGVKPEIIYETADIAWLKSIVRANLGLGFLVKDAILPNEGLVGLKIDDPLREEFHVSVVYRKTAKLSHHEAILLQILLKIKV